MPWRQNRSPYAVWISEVMLQQTQVAVVVPYFERWMNRFPTISHLAEADLAEVIKLWEGLGYYSRARNLHAAAQYLVAYHAGQVPEDRDALARIKGIGPYTLGAILSFAFGKKAAAVDGNVIRVITRYLGIEGDTSKQKTVAEIREAVENLLPDERPFEVMEGLIELGAKVCRKKPICDICPLADSCQQRIDLPYNSRKISTTTLHRQVAVIESEGAFLLRQGDPNQIMAGLYEFPYFEDAGDICTLVEQQLGLPVTLISAMHEVTHTFTRYRAHLQPWLLHTEEPLDTLGFTWCSSPDDLPFSSGHRRILNAMQSGFTSQATTRH